MSQVAERYSSALYEVAVSKNRVESYLADAKLVLNSLESEWNVFFKAVEIERETKKDVLRKGYGEVLDQYFLNFLCILVDRNRFNYVKEILELFVHECNKGLNIKEAQVYSARPLTEDQAYLIRKGLEEKFNSKVEVINKVDETLITGIKVEIEGRVIDSTMKTRINKLKSELLKEGR